MSAFALCALCWFGCQLNQTKTSTPNLSALEIVPHPDTVNLAVNATESFSLRGTSVSTSQQQISNSGVITDAEYTVTTTDTTTEAVSVGDAQWATTNSAVVSASRGVVTAVGPGVANIIASVGNVVSPPLVVSVQAVNTAPGLTLNPPLVSVIFTSSVTVSGNVQTSAKLIVSEASSGHNDQNVAYAASTGAFAETVSGLLTGFRTIVVTAQNPNQPSLATTRYKYVYYYTYLSSAADSICGNWQGTTLGRNFNFNISRDQFLPRYDINGHIDIQFDGLGLVRDVTLTGIVNQDGTMSVSLTQTYEGFTISGNLGGYFKTTGTGEGSYAASAKKTGWPSVSGSADWTAVKLP